MPRQLSQRLTMRWRTDATGILVRQGYTSTACSASSASSATSGRCVLHVYQPSTGTCAARPSSLFSAGVLGPRERAGWVRECRLAHGRVCKERCRERGSCSRASLWDGPAVLGAVTGGFVLRFRWWAASSDIARAGRPVLPERGWRTKFNRDPLGQGVRLPKRRGHAIDSCCD